MDSIPSSQRNTVTNIIEDSLVTRENQSDLMKEIEVEKEIANSNIDNLQNCNLNKKPEVVDSAKEKKRRKTSYSEERLHLLKQIAKRNSVSFQENLDETDHFFLSMAKIVKKLDRVDQVTLRMEIATLIGNAELKNISNEEPSHSNPQLVFVDENTSGFSDESSFISLA